MYCSFVLWDLARSSATVASLRHYLRDYAVDAYSQVEGMRQKTWVSWSGPMGEVWGAIYLWDDIDLAFGRAPQTSTVVDLIGYPPTQRMVFQVEAAVEGISAIGALMKGVGAAFTESTDQTGTGARDGQPG